MKYHETQKRLLAHFADHEELGFFFDVDGTLLPIARSPSLVKVDQALITMLGRLMECSAGAVALISGRTVCDLDRLFAPRIFPAAGQHGMERRNASGNLDTFPLLGSNWLADIRKELSTWVAGHPGTLLEDKGQTLALHYRSRPELAGEAYDLMKGLMGQRGDFLIQPSKMVFELKPAGKDKGSAVREFLDEPPFSGRMPVFFGDDVTDEYAFEIVNQRGGISVKIGSGPTVAHSRLTGVDAVRSWLSGFLAMRC